VAIVGASENPKHSGTATLIRGPSWSEQTVPVDCHHIAIYPANQGIALRRKLEPTDFGPHELAFGEVSTSKSGEQSAESREPKAMALQMLIASE
jgi:hypothetical protein